MTELEVAWTHHTRDYPGRRVEVEKTAFQATPMTYWIAADSRQYIAIAAGGHSTLGTNVGDALVAFALPAASAPAGT